jgi:chromate transporter
MAQVRRARDAFVASDRYLTAASPATSEVPRVPQESLARIFARFLHFGALAWGGPVAQIAMLRQAFVEDERWVTAEHFNRVLALYQVLPGPEAHEMCVYFGMLSRGRIGGILAGLGFMLPGFALMFLLSWLYVRYGLDRTGPLALVFASVQAAVAALIVRAVHQIGRHALLDGWLWAIALVSFAAQLLSVPFAIILATGGLICLLARHASPRVAIVSAIAACAALAMWSYRMGLYGPAGTSVDAVVGDTASGVSSLAQLFVPGLKAGLLTFGGAYTAIPILQHDAVTTGAWMSNAQFLDGLALSGLLPAPLIIFATFVGYIGGGPVGALVLTAGVFLPAFAMTLIAHEPLERLVHHPRARTFLTGVMAAVVGLIAGTAVTFLIDTLSGIWVAVVFALALAALFSARNKLAIPLVIMAAAALGGVASVI